MYVFDFDYLARTTNGVILETNTTLACKASTGPHCLCFSSSMNTTEKHGSVSSIQIAHTKRQCSTSWIRTDFFVVSKQHHRESSNWCFTVVKQDFWKRNTLFPTCIKPSSEIFRWNIPLCAWFIMFIYIGGKKTETVTFLNNGDKVCNRLIAIKKPLPKGYRSNHRVR